MTYHREMYRTKKMYKVRRRRYSEVGMAGQPPIIEKSQGRQAEKEVCLSNPIYIHYIPFVTLRYSLVV